MQYSLIEMLKDKVIVSNKYEPITAVNSKDIVVIVMANFEPDFEKISADRIVFVDCLEDDI